MKTHRLKTHPVPFHAVADGSKTFEIRRRSANGESRRSLGLEFGVSSSAVHSVVKRETWNHA